VGVIGLSKTWDHYLSRGVAISTFLFCRERGMGTFYPMYYTLAERAKQALEQAQQQRRQGPVDANPQGYTEELIARGERSIINK
jgi:hypothetical protein